MLLYLGLIGFDLGRFQCSTRLCKVFGFMILELYFWMAHLQQNLFQVATRPGAQQPPGYWYTGPIEEYSEPLQQPEVTGVVSAVVE